jgi:hypothetical protein
MASFLGITTVQGWFYFHNNLDKWPLRTFVRVLQKYRYHFTSDATRRGNLGSCDFVDILPRQGQIRR